MTAWQCQRWQTTVPGAWPRRRMGLLVRLRIDRVTGVGEATPMPGYCGDDIAAAEQALTAAFDDARWVTAAIAADLAALADLAAAVSATSPAAACALETAALDVAGRRTGRPLADLVGELIGTTAPRRVPVNVVVGPGDDAAVDRLRAAWDVGVRGVKVKVGRADRAAEVDLAVALRAEFGASLELRLDANGAWTPDGASDAMATFLPANPTFCEQPVPAGQLADLGATPFPFAADESMGHGDDRDRLLNEPPTALAAVVLKPMTLGGPLACARLAARAWAAGVPSIVTHMLDGPVGLGVAAELAAALPGPALACGLAAHPGLGPWAIELAHLGTADAGSAGRPGLGLDVTTVPA